MPYLTDPGIADQDGRPRPKPDKAAGLDTNRRITILGAGAPQWRDAGKRLIADFPRPPATANAKGFPEFDGLHAFQPGSVVGVRRAGRVPLGSGCVGGYTAIDQEAVTADARLD